LNLLALQIPQGSIFSGGGLPKNSVPVDCLFLFHLYKRKHINANEKTPINEPITAPTIVDLLLDKLFAFVEEVDTGKECEEYVGDTDDGNDGNDCGDDCDGCGDDCGGVCDGGCDGICDGDLKKSVHTYSSSLLISSNKISFSIDWS
jgi:hypothetical protein